MKPDSEIIASIEAKRLNPPEGPCEACGYFDCQLSDEIPQVGNTTGHQVKVNRDFLIRICQLAMREIDGSAAPTHEEVVLRAEAKEILNDLP